MQALLETCTSRHSVLPSSSIQGSSRAAVSPRSGIQWASATWTILPSGNTAVHSWPWPCQCFRQSCIHCLHAEVSAGVKLCDSIMWSVLLKHLQCASQVAEDHPDWLYSILDLALKLVESSASSEAVAQPDIFTTVGNLCMGVQDTTQALINLKELRWGLPQSQGQLSQQQSEAATEQAMRKGDGAWSRAGVLIAGLKLSLYVSGIRDVLAEWPGGSGSPGEDGSLPEAMRQKLTELRVVCQLAELLRRGVAEVSMQLQESYAGFHVVLLVVPV